MLKCASSSDCSSLGLYVLPTAGNNIPHLRLYIYSTLLHKIELVRV